MLHQIALIFPRVPSFSPCQVLSRPILSENENVAFRKLRHFLSSRVLVSSNCKQSTTVYFLLSTFYWHCFKAWWDLPI